MMSGTIEITAAAHALTPDHFSGKAKQDCLSHQVPVVCVKLGSGAWGAAC